MLHQKKNADYGLPIDAPVDVENVESTGLTSADLSKEDEDTDVWINIQKGLEIRANDSFRLTELNDDGRPITATWSSLRGHFSDYPDFR